MLRRSPNLVDPRTRSIPIGPSPSRATRASRTQTSGRAARTRDPGGDRGGALLRHVDVRGASLPDPVGIHGAHAARVHGLRRRPHHGRQAQLPLRPPQPGDVIVFKGPPPWNIGYKSIRSHNTALRWVQNALSFVGFVPPDENDLVKRVIAVGGQTVQCRADTGLTVDGKPLKEPYLDPQTMTGRPGGLPVPGQRVRARRRSRRAGCG